LQIYKTVGRDWQLFFLGNIWKKPCFLQKKKQKKPPKKIEIKHKFSLKILINIFG
jgi:hypothetical protein